MSIWRFGRNVCLLGLLSTPFGFLAIGVCYRLNLLTVDGAFGFGALLVIAGVVWLMLSALFAIETDANGGR